MSPRDKLQQFLDELDPKILERGEEYFYSGRVVCLEWNETCVSAEVSGSEAEPYQVEIDLSETGEIEDWYCGCPYDWGPVCKHTAAVLLAVLEGTEQTQKNKHGRRTCSDTLHKLMEQAEQPQLVRLILDYCDKDTRFRNYVLSELEDTGELLFEGIQRKIQASIFINTDGNYIDWKGCDNICNGLNDALYQVQRRIQWRQYGKTLDIALYIFLTALNLAESADDSSGSLGYTIDIALETIQSIAEGLAEQGGERKAWVKKFLDAAQSDAFDGWDDWRYTLLQSAALLADVQNENDFYAALDRISDSQRNNIYASRSDRLTRYYVMCAAHGQDAARPYLENNLDVEELRLILVQENMATGDYASAERLCLKMVEDNLIRLWVRPSQWQYLLYDIYRGWGKRDKQIEQAQTLALFGDKQFYQTAKTLLTEDGRWEQEYPKFREALKDSLSENAYMELLNQEGEAALLMEQVQLHPRDVFRYGATLAPQYGAEVFLLCSAIIRGESERVSNRKEYQNLCAMIFSLAGFGAAAEAQQLIDELRQTYPGRPALLDELGKVERIIKAEI